MKDFLAEFALGFTTPFRALNQILFKPKLLALCILPVMITLGVMAIFIYASLTSSWVAASHALIVAKLGTLLGAFLGSFLGFTFHAIATLVLFFAAFHAALYLVSILSIPFNDWLALQTEIALGETPPADRGFGNAFRIMRLDFYKTALNLILMILFTLASWLPGIGLISFLGISLLNTLNFVSYPQSRRLMGVFDSFAWLKKNGPRSLGFGISATFIFSIPVINFFALPVLVVSGTMVYFKR